MNLLALFAFLITVAGWILTGFTGMNLLSGDFDDRTCQTDCVQSLFFAAVASGFTGLTLSIIALFRPAGRILSVLSLLLALALCSVFGALYVAGNFI